MKINHLELKDKAILEDFFNKKEHFLSNFSFVNIFIWKDFFDFFWAVIEGNLCLFAKNNIGCFMYLPPMGSKVTQPLMDNCFKIMDRYNQDKNISRIENIEEDSLPIFKKFNLILKPKDSEYTYKVNKLISLSGNGFKGKRSAYNYFVKNYNFHYCQYNSEFKADCLNLYKNWSQLRKDRYKDPIYQAMLNDNFKVHSQVFDGYKNLGLIGRVVKIDDKVKAYSFGFKLNKHTFCILLEIADLSFKGLAQFIFREFVQEMSNFKFINVMDDSGLENIKKTKLSYQPYKLIPNFIAYRCL